jgi:hypothetical protein
MIWIIAGVVEKPAPCELVHTYTGIFGRTLSLAREVPKEAPVDGGTPMEQVGAVIVDILERAGTW